MIGLLTSRLEETKLIQIPTPFQSGEKEDQIGWNKLEYGKENSFPPYCKIIP